MKAQTLQMDACSHCCGTGKTYDEKTTGPALREMREDVGMSLREMAGRMKVSPAWLSKMEKGEAKPPNKRVAQYVAIVFGQPMGGGNGKRKQAG